MNTEFIPYEQALALKKLGFDEPCFAFYTPEKQLIIARGDILQSSVENAPSTPLYQQAFRWFREKYDIVAYTEAFQGGVYDYVLSADEFELEDFGDGYFNTYQEAELACLKQLIEIVKK